MSNDTTHPVPCFKCHRPLLSVEMEIATVNQPRDATAFSTYGHWGSTFFDSGDGERLEINICSPCLESAMGMDLIYYFRNDEDDNPEICKNK